MGGLASSRRTQPPANVPTAGQILYDDTGLDAEASLLYTGFQYVDSLIDGDDLLYLVRPASARPTAAAAAAARHCFLKSSSPEIQYLSWIRPGLIRILVNPGF